MKKYLVAAVCVVALVVGGLAIAEAAIPDAQGVIHACRHNISGGLRVIDSEAGQTCSGNETALNWNQTGPQGPQGPPGASGHQIVLHSFFIGPGNNSFDGIAPCPPGKVVVGGGYILPGNVQDADLHVVANHPNGGQPSGWVLGGQVVTPLQSTLLVRVYAICLTTGV